MPSGGLAAGFSDRHLAREHVAVVAHRNLAPDQPLSRPADLWREREREERLSPVVARNEVVVLPGADVHEVTATSARRQVTAARDAVALAAREEPA
jgi:hypothetical protein